jgi:hypothetical protein
VTSTVQGTTLKAIAFKANWITSAVKVATYSMPQVATPAFNPSGANTPAFPLSVTITTSTTGASIRYTLDDTTPTENNGTLISAPSGSVSLSAAAVVKAEAFKSGWVTSAVQTGSYVMRPGDPPGPASTPPPN